MTKLSTSEFEMLYKFIETATGIQLPDTNIDLVKRFVLDRLLTSNISFNTYYARLQNKSEEYNDFFDAVTIGETYLFREEKHFKIIDEVVLPELVSQKQTIALWSAACANGCEAYSLAVLCAHINENRKFTFSVLSSDINRAGLTVCERGELPLSALRDDGSSFQRLIEQNATIIKNKKVIDFKKEIKEYITVQNINLYQDEFEKVITQKDIIFLRNLFIYMSDKARVVILEKIIQTLSNGGFLFLSSSEVPFVAHAALQLREYNGTYFFKKKI